MKDQCVGDISDFEKKGYSDLSTRSRVRRFRGADGRRRRHAGGDDGRVWWNVYPTEFGIEQVLGQDELDVEMVPLLREIVRAEPIVALTISGDSESAELGAQRRSPTGLYFSLRYLKEKGLVDFNHYYESGNDAVLMELKTTALGRRRGADFRWDDSGSTSVAS